MHRGRRWLLFLYFFLAWLAVGCGVHVSAGRIHISEIGICREIDANGQPVQVTSVFPAGTRIVYVYFKLESPVAVPLEFRWYHEDTLVGTAKQRMEAGLRNAWMAAEEGKFLPAGNYRVEIIAGGTMMGEASFTIR